MRLEVSIEQDDCTSCGQCPDIAERHFFMADDGIAYVQENTDGDPTQPQFVGYAGKVLVSSELESDVIEAAEYCPGECIYVEPACDTAPIA